MQAKSDKTELEPGNNAEIVLEAKPHSFIGVLGVDQSVLLLRSGNDLTHVSETLIISDNHNSRPS